MQRETFNSRTLCCKWIHHHEKGRHRYGTTGTSRPSEGGVDSQPIHLPAFPFGGGSQSDSRRHHVALLVTRLSLFPSSLHPYSEWRPENGSMRGELKLQSADYNSAASSLQSSRGPRSGWMLEINMRGVSLRCSLARPTPGHSGLLPGPQTTACNWGLTWINKW